MAQRKFVSTYMVLGHPDGNFNETVPVDIDVLICAVNPSATQSLIRLFKKKLPVYFLHKHKKLEPLFPAATPFVIASTSRAGSTWLGQMICYMAEDCGYHQIRYPITTTNGVIVRDEALDELKPGRFLAGPDYFPDRLVPHIEKGSIQSVFLYRGPRDVLVPFF